MLTIPEATPSRNKFHHKHWRVESASKKRWGLMILVAAKLAKAAPAQGMRRVRIDRYGSRRLDEDNFIGGAKGILDSLKEQKLIIDDNADGIELLWRQMKPEPRQKAFTTITLEDIE